MKAIDTMSPEAVALTAACRLHGELLADECFAGYNGTKDAFDNLYRELFVIALEENEAEWLEVDPVEIVVEAFYVFQFEISEGVRKVDWFLYR